MEWFLSKPERISPEMCDLISRPGGIEAIHQAVDICRPGDSTIAVVDGQEYRISIAGPHYEFPPPTPALQRLMNWARSKVGA